LITFALIKVLKSHLNIDNFRKNDAVNGKWLEKNITDKGSFIRKGKVGDWKNHFSCAETLKEFNEWIQENNKDCDGNPIEGIKYNI